MTGAGGIGPEAIGTHAVVLGGGLAGMLTAAALARHTDRVTVVERDELPDHPAPRKGVPQTRQLHVLMSGGARAMDVLLPGTTARLRALGAHRLGVPEDVVTLSADGWQHRFPATQFMITCTRDLIDWVVRDQVLRDPKVRVRTGVEIAGLLGDADRVTGVRVTGVDGSGARDLAADLVVDCTGRASRLEHWLGALGVPPIPTEVVDSGLAYSTRIYAAPEAHRTGFPVVNLFSDYRAGRPGRSASLVPVEGGRWLIGLTGTRGARPPVDEAGFADYAASLRDPLISRLMRAARPLTEPRGSHSAANRRLYCERVERWPDGLVVLGDALVAFNPVYGTGMSSAARCAVVLAGVLAGHGHEPGLARAAQHAIGEVVATPWITATTQDVRYPDCRTSLVDPRALEVSEEQDRVGRWIGALSLRHAVVNAAMTEVITMTSPLSALQRPEVVAAMTGAGSRPVLREAPLRPAERALVDEHSDRVDA
ncbi:FAD-dependent monooxygenase [Actinosynnema sp. NPDC051121]